MGGHSASFIARELLDHAAGAIDCVLKGEGEASLVRCSRRSPTRDARGLLEVPGVVTHDGQGPAPGFVKSLEDLLPARDLLRHRRKYFIGVLDPCASIEFSRGCPWDCSFCSAWTFYGRSYRIKGAEAAAAELAQIREPGVFIVDDVAFIQAEHGMAIGEAIARRGIKKQYLPRDPRRRPAAQQGGLPLLEDARPPVHVPGRRGDRRRGAEAVPQARDAVQELRGARVRPVAGDHGRDQHHRRPAWDRRQFEVIRQWCLEIPEIVNISVNTPYPGTESWLTESRRLTTRDYRLFDIQHAVLPTRAPAGRVLPRAGQHAAGAQPQAPGLDRRSSRWPASWPATWPAARPTRSRCSGSSTASTTPAADSPTTSSPSATSWRRRRRPRT